jgi:hypothetical protein
MRLARRVFAALLVVVALGALGLVCERVTQRGRFAVAYSTYGAGPGGARGLHLLAEALGRRPLRWAEDFGRLPERALLVALGGCELLAARPVSPVEQRWLAGWVERGGVLVVAGAHDYLAPALGVTLERAAGACEPRAGLLGALARAQRDAGPTEDAPDAGLPSPLDIARDPVAAVAEAVEQDPLPEAVPAHGVGGPLVGFARLPLRDPARVELHDPLHTEVLLRLDDERVAGALVRRGRGAVVALASSSPLLNRELRAGEGGVLFARLLRAFPDAGPVVFDEYHLGVGERRSIVRYLGDFGGGALLVQALLVVLFVLWRRGARFGGEQRALPLPPAGTASYVAGIASLYARAGDPGAAAAILARRALVRIAAHHRLPSPEPGALAEALTARGRSAEAAAVRTLASLALQPLRGDAALVARAREIDAACLAALGPAEGP